MPSSGGAADSNLPRQTQRRAGKAPSTNDFTDFPCPLVLGGALNCDVPQARRQQLAAPDPAARGRGSVDHRLHRLSLPTSPRLRIGLRPPDENPASSDHARRVAARPMPSGPQARTQVAHNSRRKSLPLVPTSSTLMQTGGNRRRVLQTGAIPRIAQGPRWRTTNSPEGIGRCP